MEKKFNVSGVCYSNKHYMVDLGGRLEEIKRLVDNGDYFVINRARQYGKTTTLRALKKYLEPDYAVISMSFQKMSSAKFRDEYLFSQAFANEFVKKARSEAEDGRLSLETVNKLESRRKEERDSFDLTEMFEGLSEICGTAKKKVVLMIDEVDQASNNQVFYGREEFVVELKRWKGDAYEQKGYDQLAEYLEAKGLRQGFDCPKCEVRNIFEMMFWNILYIMASSVTDKKGNNLLSAGIGKHFLPGGACSVLQGIS